ncbi:MAG: carbohydrate binding family 9 domain-containing protein [Candidatus Eisenbacteria bacterium]|nr:carbohydrate binding family 9 domain-containing protein [Candidatus Eisenbacteria bacterium]
MKLPDCASRTGVCAVACAAFALSALVAGPGSAAAAEKVPQRVPRVASPIVVDGVLDEDVWREALVMGVNTEVRPGENIPAPVHTDMLLAYNDTHFLVAFRALDPDPSLIRARYCDRDQMWADEFVIVGVDTYNDQRGGFEFACNPLGIQGDTANGVHGDGNSWDAIWDSAGRIFDWGYSVEMAIPFSSLKFQRTEGDQIWGVDAVRSYPRGVRRHIGLYARDRNNNCYFCQMEKLVGFAGVNPGRSIELDPTFSAITSQQREGFVEGPFEERDSSYGPGLTARWGVTPNTTLAAALNPDFSQVEADAFQLDVNTRHALWYDEKRPFFLESAGMFPNFYSRSVADPAWGVKLTAKEGGNGFGALVSRDEVTNLILPMGERSRTASLDRESTCSLLRYSRDVGRSSSISAVFNDRRGDEYANQMGGVRADLMLAGTYGVNAAALFSSTDYPDSLAADYSQESGRFDGHVYSLHVGRYTSGLDVYGQYYDVSRGFRNDLGFVPDVGHRDVELGAGHTWQRDAGSWWTMLNAGGCYRREETEDGDVRAEGARLWAHYNGPKESHVEADGWVGTEVFAGEEFDTWSAEVETGFWPTGWLFAMLEGKYARAIDYANARNGDLVAVFPYVGLKAGRHLSANVGQRYERMNVDEGRLYTANVTYLKAVYQFSPEMFVRAILQYVDCDRAPELHPFPVEPEEQSLTSQVLFSYKLNPQTVLFLGYGDAHYGSGTVDLTQTDRTFFAKVGYAWTL